MHRCIHFGISAFLSLAFAIDSAGEVRIEGGGATFPQPLYEQWIADYQKLHADVRIDYNGVGSAAGIKALADRSVQFAASDRELTSDDLTKLGGRENLIMFPTCEGAVVIVYNVPGLTKELNLTGPVLADIYLGKVTEWSDARLAALNPGLSLPKLRILPGWRTDGSSTTATFTQYLAACSHEFRDTVGTGMQVHWPVGVGGKGGAGPVATVLQNEGAIMYTEFNYAVKNQIPFASIENERGKFVKANSKAVSAAGDAAAPHMTGPILTKSILRQPGADVYPIASFTYIVLRKDLSNCRSREQAHAVLAFLRWAVHGGQKDAADLGYAPLGEAMQGKVSQLLKSLTYKGDALDADH